MTSRALCWLLWPQDYWPGLSNPGQVLSYLSFSEMGHLTPRPVHLSLCIELCDVKGLYFVRFICL